MMTEGNAARTLQNERRESMRPIPRYPQNRPKVSSSTKNQICRIVASGSRKARDPVEKRARYSQSRPKVPATTKWRTSPQRR
ncbi:hypothetical protein M404DRAFT_991443 [Pisolithus tinctorius Marx 270]|uniref:Uncharacterized protein n=1 Tax=Pisolithus tinctorius Marx 270 TaxID=870435 RepID=A0A0C3PKE4_PISTI|nr:hypothetical protein M404DRAFT_991443 [Pisolithus tinctorius Marx 270]